MTIQFITTTLQGSGVGRTLAQGADLVVTATGQILDETASGFGFGIALAGGNNVTILGTVAAAAGGVVPVDTNPGGGNSVTVGTTGTVILTGPVGSAIRLENSSVLGPNAIFNEGLLSSSAAGVGLSGDAARLSNGGRIVAAFEGVFISSDDFVIRNSGRIDAGLQGIYANDSADGLVLNTGTISGAATGLFVSGDGTAATGGNRVENAGLISGRDGIVVRLSEGFTLVNTGTIQAPGHALSVIASQAPKVVNAGTMSSLLLGDLGASVENTGLILGGVSFADTVSGGATNVLDNTGTITAGGFAQSANMAVIGSDVQDLVTNAGTLRGAVVLGTDNDLYDGALGLVLGLVQGDDGNDTLSGGRGAETLLGGSGSDIIAGGEGNDFLQAGVGLTTDRDVMDGGAGNDVLLGSIGLDLLDGGDGTDTLFGGDNADTLRGGAARDELYGEAGADVLDGGEGHDLLQGDAGADLINGGAGDDIINGNADADTIDGGDGNDRIRPGAGADVIDGGDGLRDILDYIGSAGVNVNLTLGEGTGGDAQGDDFTGIEWLSGSSFNDILAGDGLANGLFGGAGNDLLIGAAGNDMLAGDAGNDTLTGGAGVDVLRGGLNADVFRFTLPGESGAAGAARDRILDFNKAQLDRIDLAIMDADAVLAGNQAFTFVGTAAFTAAGQVRAQVIGGDTFVFGNTDAVLTTTEFSIRLTGAITLAATDFIL
jgi:Ca2+-binding RTX toxin-like protein